MGTEISSAASAIRFIGKMESWVSGAGAGVARGWNVRSAPDVWRLRQIVRSVLAWSRVLAACRMEDWMQRLATVLKCASKVNGDRRRGAASKSGDKFALTSAAQAPRVLLHQLRHGGDNCFTASTLF